MFSFFRNSSPFKSLSVSHHLLPRRDGRHYSRTRVGRGSETVRYYLDYWNRKFQAQDVPESKESIEHIMSGVLQCSRVELLRRPWRRLLQRQRRDLQRRCGARLLRAPVQYIVGEWDFCEVRLRVRAPVLVPRPETEQLAQLAAARLRQLPSARLLDVGCGSGALCCSLLHQLPHMSALAVDQSAEACRLTAENAALNGVGDRLEVRHLALTEDDLPGVGSNLFDMVVSNPPYVPSGDVDRLQPEILLYEDRAALDGGADGLEVVRLLVRAAADWLRPGGLLLLEVDPRQPAAISRLVLPGHHRLTYRSTHCDFSGRHRFVELVRSAEPAAG